MRQLIAFGRGPGHGSESASMVLVVAADATGIAAAVSNVRAGLLSVGQS